MCDVLPSESFTRTDIKQTSNAQRLTFKSEADVPYIEEEHEPQTRSPFASGRGNRSGATSCPSEKRRRVAALQKPTHARSRHELREASWSAVTCHRFESPAPKRSQLSN